MMRELSRCALAVVATAGLWSCGEADDPGQVAAGREVFRHDTFGDERFWTDTLRMNEVIETAVDPVTALSVGLKVDSEALPAGLLQSADLRNPATTVALLKLNAVVGLKGTVVTENGRDRLTRVGTTCALCHSTVDDSVHAGHRPPAGRLGQHHPESRRHHRALAGAQSVAEGRLQLVGSRDATTRASTSTGGARRS